MKKTGKAGATVIVLPQTDDHTLCVEFTGLIRAEDHRKAFAENLGPMVEKNGWYNILIYHRPDFKGWEPDAADISLRTIMEYGKFCRRRAVVSPTEKLIMMQKMSGQLFGGETKYFNDDQFQEALAWVRGGKKP